MQADAYSELRAFGPLDRSKAALYVDGGRDRIGGPLECGEVRVALSIDDVALVLATRLFDQPAMVDPDVAESMAEPANEVASSLRCL